MRSARAPRAPDPSLSLDPRIELLLVLLGRILACVPVHGIGMTLVIRWIGRVVRGEDSSAAPTKTFWRLVRVVHGLLVPHTLQILVWAAHFLFLDCFPDFETCFDCSATSYSTVGFGDVTPPLCWRILGSMEAVTGVLMFGWSKGALFSVAQRTVALPAPRA